MQRAQCDWAQHITLLCPNHDRTQVDNAMIPALHPPASNAMPVGEIDTPALIVDLNAFDANLALMAERIATVPNVRLRAHAKTHKCPAIGRRQMELGAIGVCCQKVGEAQAMVAGGIDNVLVTNQIVGQRKIACLAALAKNAWIGVCVDHADNVEALSTGAVAAKTTLHVLVEINVGANRCGVDSPQAALDLAQRIQAAPGLRFAGLQAYQGSAQHKRAFAEREAAIAEAVRRTGETRTRLAQAAIDCPIVGGAGTGTFEFELNSGVYNELQAGSYIFMDADYGHNLDAHGQPEAQFKHSLFIYTTVMSTAAGHYVVDAGHKAHSADAGPPLVADFSNARYDRPSDDHGIITFTGDGPCPALGDKLRLIPGHCDPTVNLYDWLVGVRNDRVECVWQVTARGATR